MLRLLDGGWDDSFDIANLKGVTPAKDIAKESVKDGILQNPERNKYVLARVCGKS